MKIENDPNKRGTDKTAFLVDDNTAIREMLAHAFLSDGFKACGEAAKGREAIVLAKQINPRRNRSGPLDAADEWIERGV